MATESKAAVTAAIIGNAALTVLKGVAAAATGSAAMLAETIHSAADTGNEVLLMLGLRLARRPPDAAHPFGHGQNVYFWAFMVSVMLFTLGGAFSIWEAVQRLRHAEAAHRAYAWAYGVLAGAFVFESGSLAVAVHSLRRTMGRRSLVEYQRENRDPTLMTVLLEDSAALTSILIAAAGVVLTQRTGAALWDAGASGLIGLVLIGVAVFLAFENYSLLIGEAAPRDLQVSLRRAVESDEAVERLAMLKTLHLGPQTLLVAAAVEFRDGLSTAEIQAAVARLHAAVRRAAAGTVTLPLVLIEPAAERRRDAGRPS